MPTNEVWTRVCRKLMDLEEIRDSIVKSTATTKAFKKFANETTLLHQKLRENGFNSNPCIYGEMRSIDGNELDKDLVDLKYTAEENYKCFEETFFKTGKYNAKIFKPVFVTKTELEEFQKIENKTKFYIMEEIRKILDEMPDKEAAANWKRDMKGNVKHHQLVSMFYNVKSIYNEQILSKENDEGEE